jgi:hypothetical protein
VEFGLSSDPGYRTGDHLIHSYTSFKSPFNPRPAQRPVVPYVPSPSP